MTKFIVHREYEGKNINGEEIKLVRGTELELSGEYIAYHGNPVCSIFSEVFKHHIAGNDDGRGLLRGKLTYAIAYANRQRILDDGIISRFSDYEASQLTDNWSQYLISDTTEVIIFSHAFFNEAPISDLKQIALMLQLKLNLTEFGYNSVAEIDNEKKTS